MCHFGRAVPVTLRRFPSLLGRTLAGESFVFPNQLPDAPFQVVSLNFKNKHVWNARTWNGLTASLDSNMNMYHVWLFPWIHKAWAPLWRRRCRTWAQEHNIKEEHIVAIYGDRDAICDQIGIHNDGRQYAFMIRNSGKVLFATDGRYLSHKHDSHIHKAIRSLAMPDETLKLDVSTETDVKN